MNTEGRGLKLNNIDKYFACFFFINIMIAKPIWFVIQNIHTLKPVQHYICMFDEDI